MRGDTKILPERLLRGIRRALDFGMSADEIECLLLLCSAVNDMRRKMPADEMLVRVRKIVEIMREDRGG